MAQDTFQNYYTANHVLLIAKRGRQTLSLWRRLRCIVQPRRENLVHPLNLATQRAPLGQH